MATRTLEPPTTTPADTQPAKRLNINLPESVYRELQELSNTTGRSMTELVRTALGLMNVAYEETGQKHVLVVADKNGKPIKQLIIPR